VTMPYQPWIKFGVDPVLPVHFWALAKPDARSFFDKVTRSIPERMGQLECLIHDHRPKLRWKPDFTEESFATVVEVMTECVETRPRTREDIKQHERSQPEIFRTLGSGIRDWEGTDRSYSIAFDAGIYWALDLQSKEPRLQWKLCTGKTKLLRNQPVLDAPSPVPRQSQWHLEIGPLDQFAVTVLRIAGKNPHQRTWIEIYRTWNEILAEYKARWNQP
jgi:hypothetical protein